MFFLGRGLPPHAPEAYLLQRMYFGHLPEMKNASFAKTEKNRAEGTPEITATLDTIYLKYSGSTLPSRAQITK